MKTYIIIDLKGSFVRKVQGASIVADREYITIFDQEMKVVALIPAQNVTAVVQEDR